MHFFIQQLYKYDRGSQSPNRVKVTIRYCALSLPNSSFVSFLFRLIYYLDFSIVSWLLLDRHIFRVSLGASIQTLEKFSALILRGRGDREARQSHLSNLFVPPSNLSYQSSRFVKQPVELLLEGYLKIWRAKQTSRNFLAFDRFLNLEAEAGFNGKYIRIKNIYLRSTWLFMISL